MHVIDLSYFVKIYRSKNKHISVNFLRHFHRPGDLHLSGTTSDLEDKLAEKAREQGAKGYVINSAGGNDQMFGTATIYK